MQERPQATNAVVMIRPRRFYPNPETAADNAFQGAAENSDELSLRAQKEFDDAVRSLGASGVTVHVFEDNADPQKPDAIFPNNWLSTHEDGRVVLYPMYSPARRSERRHEIIDALEKNYRITDVVDYSDYEKRDLFLEGTGSLVLDHPNQIAYVSLSKRADRELAEKFCSDFEYDPVIFESTGDDGRPIYHTNVMLCVGSNFALIGLQMIADREARLKVHDRLEKSGKEVIELTRSQIGNFAGNALELRGKQSGLLVLSQRAVAALTNDQRAKIERNVRLLPLSLPTIELAGGSARCMLAEIFLPDR